MLFISKVIIFTIMVKAIEVFETKDNIDLSIFDNYNLYIARLSPGRASQKPVITSFLESFLGAFVFFPSQSFK